MAPAGPPVAVPLREALRLMVITDAAQAAPRSVEEVVHQALMAGARGVQLRMKDAPAAQMLELGRVLRDLTRAVGARLFVNDRADVAIAIDADGVHTGPHDPPVAALRSTFGDRLWIGASTDDPARARLLQQEGADYLGCGAVFGTRSKDVGDEAIGVDRLAAVARAVTIPVIGIGGITASNAGRLSGSGVAGVAVIGEVMKARDVSAAVRSLLATRL